MRQTFYFKNNKIRLQEVRSRNTVKFVQTLNLNLEMNCMQKISRTEEKDASTDEKGVNNSFNDIQILEEYDQRNRLVATGQCRNGLKINTWWFYNKDGSCLVGKMDSKGTLTGDDIAYLYPDRWTALVGRFENGIMIKAKLARVAKIVKKIPEFVFVPGQNAEYKFDISTNEIISSDLTLPDPYESERVEVKKSLIPEAGDGLFAKMDVGHGVIMSYYNGIRINSDEVDARSWDENGYTMVLNNQVVLDIPSDMTDVKKYCATLAHKANHSFTPNCVTIPVYHPRFGPILAIRSKIMIKRGTELTINYGYGPRYAGDDIDVPPWYKKQMILFKK